MILEIIFIERKELKIKEELIKILVLVVFVFFIVWEIVFRLNVWYVI